LGFNGKGMGNFTRPFFRLVSFLFFFLSIRLIYTQDLQLFQSDIENYWLLGRRPLFLGVEYYINVHGSLFRTNSTTDFAIFNDGFFVLYNSNNTEVILTRNGSFQFNIQGFLVNHDGFYVLKKTSDVSNGIYYFIRYDDLFNNIYEEMEPNNHPFLIMMPDKDLVITISPEYIKSLSNISFENSRIYNNFLEAMPINLGILLSYAIDRLSAGTININGLDKKYCLELLKKRYSEMLELNNIGEQNMFEQQISMFEELLYLYPTIEK
jgi:archaellum component FlaF (FlaF/FlaG flagellin family)